MKKFSVISLALFVGAVMFGVSGHSAASPVTSAAITAVPAEAVKGGATPVDWVYVRPTVYRVRPTVYLSPRYVRPTVYLNPNYVRPTVYLSPRYVRPTVYLRPHYVRPTYYAPYVVRPTYYVVGTGWQD
jgi:hypothetical protein